MFLRLSVNIQAMYAKPWAISQYLIFLDIWDGTGPSKSGLGQENVHIIYFQLI